MGKIEIYQGVLSQWYWRYRARNGQIMADGSEGYASKSNARRAAKRLACAIALASTKEVKVQHGRGARNDG